MRATVLVVAGCALAVLFAVAFPQRNARPQAPAAAPAADSISFRVVFGNQRTAPKDYSGSVSVTGGALRNLEGWRFFQNDAITGSNSWKLQIRRAVFENQPDAPQPMANGGPAPQNIVPAGLIVTVDASAASAQFHTAQGDFVAPVRDLAYGRVLGFLDNDVQVERVPTPDRVSPQSAEEHDYPSITVTRSGEAWTAWQAYQDRGDQVYARRLGGDVTRLTTEKGDIFRTSVAEDPDGRIHVAWSERRGADWNVYERVFDGRSWSARAQITRANTPNVFHKLIAGPRALSLVWVGHENGESYLYLASYSAGRWSEPRQIGGPSVWNPDGAFDRDGNLHVAWDSYAAGNYDIYYRRIGADGAPAAIEQITKSPVFDAHPSVAVDGAGRPWVAWDQSGANWGKDWNHEDQDRSTVLYKDRSIRVVVKDGGAWKQAPDFEAAVPDRLKRYAELPHLAADASGRMWTLFQIRTSVAIQRIDYWAAGGLWDLYLTSVDQGVWQPAAFVPRSTGRNEAAFQIAAGGGRAWMIWATDGRVIQNSTGNYQAPTLVHYDVFAAQASAPAPSGSPVLAAYTEPASRPQVMHPNERDDVRRIRAYRTTVGGTEYRILRGDFHRHTDISNDGAGDGSLEDYYRYMLDAASMDIGIVGDHNMGGDVEYNWWRTEKSYDIFLIPNRYTPLFGYERSVNYPNGHRNVVFDHRGVRTLPVGAAENRAQVNSGTLVYPYLRQNRGICMEHSLATGQGTDWRDNDPDLEPLVELYQGYHAAYEYEGGPRAESANNHLLVHGSYEPAGFFWNALNKGYKLGVQASSDHISTHCSYAMIYTPAANRSDIVENMRRRHAYAATDNIILDFEAVEANGASHLMGDVLTPARGLKLRARIHGTDVITRIDLIRNNAVIYSPATSGSKDADFEYVDMSPAAGTNWYYVRVAQIDRNLAWSSPVWVTYQ
jgi:hypothetical protein